MAKFSACPYCGRKVKHTLMANWFPIHTCRDCGTKYCNECSAGRNPTCPNCGSTKYSDLDQVYS